ncbi:MAG: GNAT family N-acetyltransferase [Proteobacteria bacterium]|nr:GNAT family N-acetyltransferase [Pseudomonadota bacterium]
MAEPGDSGGDRGIVLRAARDADGPGVIAVVAAAYAEYPGCVLDVEAEAPELKAPASAYARKSGRFWVAADAAARILGCVACRPAPEHGLELEKLYVARAARRTGLGTRLLDLVEAEATARQAGYITLWTDTRFEAAHAFYKAHGFRQTGLRELDDASQSVEYGFRKDL